MNLFSSKSKTSTVSPSPVIPVPGSATSVRSDNMVGSPMGSLGYSPAFAPVLNGTTTAIPADLDKVAILDAGSQFGKVIDRRVRELNVYTEMLPLETSLAVLMEKNFKAVIISGGPGSVFGDDVLTYDPELFQSPIPVLGLCYGFQLMNSAFGGIVGKTARRNDGQTKIQVDRNCLLFKGMDEIQEVLLSHGDSVTIVPNDLTVVAKYHDLVVGIANVEKRKYGVQFHPEVDLTVNGMQIFRNFLFEIAGLRANFLMTNREQDCLSYIKMHVKNKTVLLLASGGVDSTVCAALLRKVCTADQLIILHIDNGFMRKNESRDVVETLKRLGLKVIHKDFSDIFRYARRTRPEEEDGADYVSVVSPTLMETVDPEDKRKIIGDTFMEVANSVLKEDLKLDISDVLLCQGTLRPDLIESSSKLASSHSEAIKTHHNDTNLVRQLRARGLVIEPLKDFHKDEVRRLGVDLGLPADLVYRHPFPGPGLAVRVICANEPWKAKDYDKTVLLLRIICSFSDKATWHLSVMHENVKNTLTIEEVDFLQKVTTDYVIAGHVLPIRSVGVQGDGRSFKHVAALSTDSHPIPWPVLSRLAEIIPRICQSISRVAYAFGPVIKHEIEFITETTLVPCHVVAKIQDVDYIAQKVLKESGFYRNVAQMPVILIPVVFDVDTVDPNYSGRQHSVVLRPFISNDFMTGIAALPGKHLPEEVILKMVEQIKQVGGISRVLYDLTCKPPGTTEWE